MIVDSTDISSWRGRELKEGDLPKLYIEGIGYGLAKNEELYKLTARYPQITDKHSIDNLGLGFDQIKNVCEYDNMTNCPGHMGLIKWNRDEAEKAGDKGLIPKVYIAKVQSLNDIVTCLNSVCIHCGKMFLDKKDIVMKGLLNENSAMRRSQIATDSEKMKCRSKVTENQILCKENPKFVMSKEFKEDGIMTIKKRKGGKDKGREKIYTGTDMFKILDAVTDEDARLLGFFPPKTHPRNLFWYAYPVVPQQARTKKITPESVRLDAMTKRYQHIIDAANNVLHNPMDISYQRKLFERIKELEGPKSTKKSGIYDKAPTTSELTQGKKAIPRGETQGKRTGNCARSVANPDYNLTFGETGIPRSFTENTNLVKVNDLNKNYMQKLLEDGGVESIVIEGQKVLPYPDIDEGHKLNVGDVLNIHLRDGDLSITNRQPSLHKYSMLGHTIRLHDEKTIRQHTSTCTPYNMDFDGDELNIHIPQTLSALAEVGIILDVRKCGMSTSTSDPAMATILNTITGSWLLTLPEIIVSDTFFEDSMARLRNRIGLSTFYKRLKKHGIDRRSGKALFSLLLPEDFYYHKKGVEIKDGILVNGVITKDHVGKKANSIPQILWKNKKWGWPRYSDFLTDGPYLIGSWLELHGFTVGINDCVDLREKWIYDNSKNEIVKNIVDHNKEIILSSIEQLKLSLVDMGPEPTDTKEHLNYIKKYMEEVNIASEKQALAVSESLGFKSFNDLEEDYLKAKDELESLGGAIYQPIEDKKTQSKILKAMNNLKNAEFLVEKKKEGKYNAIAAIGEKGSGAKGGMVNMVEIFATKSQQKQRGDILPRGLTQGTRRHVSFDPNMPPPPEALAYCPSNYTTGMTSLEYHMMMIADREGLTDNSTKTSETGTIQRHLIKAGESICVCYDGSVRVMVPNPNTYHLNSNATGLLLLPSYGYDTSELIKVQHSEHETITDFIDIDSIIDELNYECGYVKESVAKNASIRLDKYNDLFLSQIHNNETLIQTLTEQLYLIEKYNSQELFNLSTLEETLYNYYNILTEQQKERSILLQIINSDLPNDNDNKIFANLHIKSMNSYMGDITNDEIKYSQLLNEKDIIVKKLSNINLYYNDKNINLDYFSIKQQLNNSLLEKEKLTTLPKIKEPKGLKAIPLIKGDEYIDKAYISGLGEGWEKERIKFLQQKIVEKNNITIPTSINHRERLTKHEVARLIGGRAEQIANNDPLHPDVIPFIGNEIDALVLAKLEYYMGLIDIEITRMFPDGTYEKIKPTLERVHLDIGGLFL